MLGRPSYHFEVSAPPLIGLTPLIVIGTVVVPGIVAVVIPCLGPIFLSGTLMPLECVSTILIRLLMMIS